MNDDRDDAPRTAAERRTLPPPAGDAEELEPVDVEAELGDALSGPPDDDDEDGDA